MGTLRSTLGTHIQQAGSYVSGNRLRFDFSHFEAIDGKTLQSIEQSINEKVLENSLVDTFEVAYKDKPEDVVAVFGEKYGDHVRVVDIGGFSRELLREELMFKQLVKLALSKSSRNRALPLAHEELKPSVEKPLTP